MLELATGYRGRWNLLCVTLLATAVACGPGSPPELAGLSDQVAQVGTELAIALNGNDPDGDHLSYSFRAADLTDLDGHAAITESPSGAGVFKWTPTLDDLGSHAFEFTASDAIHHAKATISIDVRSAIGSATAPVFRQPSGDGATLDLKRAVCIDIDVVVDDSDSSTVQIVEADPAIDGATITARDGQTATWHWCPTREQQAQPRYGLVLAADDGSNPRTLKNYLVVLRGDDGANCPGAAPTISHTAHDASSIVDLAIDATISDDKGIKDAPLLYYAMTQPGTPPDLTTMTLLTMQRTSGDAMSGVYGATVPNPLAQMPAGTRQTVYYAFVANDNDDTVGTCNHTTTSQVYSMAVTSTGTADLPICAPCTSDAQCGRGDECVRMGASGTSFCLQACGTGCPSGYTCSTAPVASVDGASAPQCEPPSGSCEMTTSACMDDTWEVNDSLGQATSNPALTPGSYTLVSCPSATDEIHTNDDWFRFVVASDQRVDLQLSGGDATDLDLHLYQSDGTPITASTGPDASEDINLCLPAATYYVKVNGFGNSRNPYALNYTSRAESCTQVCVDDSHEPDSSAAQARDATAALHFASSGNQICRDNDDYYKVLLFTDDLLIVDLLFSQTTASQDLDIHVYRGGVDLTPCDPGNTSGCLTDNGQGATSNEHAEFLVGSSCDAGCEFDVVVHGYNHSVNSYDIAIDIE
jgi:hypothetical protein